MAKKKLEMDIIHLHCAGIDIGSRSHFVAVGQSLEDVKEFDVYADDLTDICLHLKQHEVTSVAGKHRQLLAKPLCGTYQTQF